MMSILSVKSPSLSSSQRDISEAIRAQLARLQYHSHKAELKLNVHIYFINNVFSGSN